MHRPRYAQSKDAYAVRGRSTTHGTYTHRTMAHHEHDHEQSSTQTPRPSAPSQNDHGREYRGPLLLTVVLVILCAMRNKSAIRNQRCKKARRASPRLDGVRWTLHGRALTHTHGTYVGDATLATETHRTTQHSRPERIANRVSKRTT